MFEESVRSKLSYGDVDEVEKRLIEVIKRNVASGVIASAIDLSRALAKLNRELEQKLEGLHPRDEDGHAELYRQERPVLQRIMADLGAVSEVIRKEIIADPEARHLLYDLSGQSSCHRSAIRDAVHLIADAGVKEVHINNDEIVEEMAGAA